MQPSMHDIRQFIMDTFFLGSRVIDLRDRDSLLATGLIDAPGVLELVAFLERHYGMRISDDDITPDNLDSIERIHRFLCRLLTKSTQNGTNLNSGSH